jgi:hypothetical protein
MHPCVTCLSCCIICSRCASIQFSFMAPLRIGSMRWIRSCLSRLPTGWSCQLIRFEETSTAYSLLSRTVRRAFGFSIVHCVFIGSVRASPNTIDFCFCIAACRIGNTNTPTSVYLRTYYTGITLLYQCFSNPSPQTIRHCPTVFHSTRRKSSVVPVNRRPSSCSLLYVSMCDGNVRCL